MKILENRVLSALIAILIVIGSTAWNVNRNLSREADKLEEVWSEKYGVEEKLTERCSEASQLWSVLRNYDTLSEECAALRNSYNAIYNTELSMYEASVLFSLNEELSSASLAAMKAAENASLSSDDREWAERYYSNMINAQRLIENSDYHEAQQQYAALLNAPHIRFLLPLLSKSIPEQFA